MAEFAISAKFRFQSESIWLGLLNRRIQRTTGRTIFLQSYSNFCPTQQCHEIFSNFDTLTIFRVWKTKVLKFANQISEIYWSCCGTQFSGQLISRCLFGVFNSPKKRTKKIDFAMYYGTSSWIVFVRLFGRIEDSKKTFRN